jgi:hypothetical protein
VEFANQFFSGIPVGFWWATVGPLVLSTILMVVKNKTNGLSDKAMMALTGTFAFLGALLEYALRWFGDNPSALGEKTMMVVGIMTFCYRYIVKPADALLKAAKDGRELKAADGEAAAPVKADLPLLEEPALVPAAITSTGDTSTLPPSVSTTAPGVEFPF